MRVCTVVGARPQFIKAAVVSHAMQAAGVTEVMLHTGQHYDAEMSQVFFDELGIPAPAQNLAVGSGSHAEQTGAMMVALEQAILNMEGPDWVLVYGDTNSTLAAALVAAKLHIPVAHVEAGLRSFNRQMPEEINRIVTDRLSALLLCPTSTAVQHLANEGMTAGVHLVGDVMHDATLVYGARAATHGPLADITAHAPKTYWAATVHRAENTNDPQRLQSIFSAFGDLADPVLLPLHPRTAARLDAVDVPENVAFLDPLGYLHMLTFVKEAKGVLTDSGGLQKEAYWLGTPCITLRTETEWTETTVGRWNQVIDADRTAIRRAAQQLPDAHAPRPPFGAVAEGRASGLIVKRLCQNK